MVSKIAGAFERAKVSHYFAEQTAGDVKENLLVCRLQLPAHAIASLTGHSGVEAGKAPTTARIAISLATNDVPAKPRYSCSCSHCHFCCCCSAAREYRM